MLILLLRSYISNSIVLFQVISGLEGLSILLAKLLTLSETLPAVQKWVQGPVLGSRLVTVAEEVCSAGSPEDKTSTNKQWEIISMALSSFKNEG